MLSGVLLRNKQHIRQQIPNNKKTQMLTSSQDLPTYEEVLGNDLMSSITDLANHYSMCQIVPRQPRANPAKQWCFTWFHYPVDYKSTLQQAFLGAKAVAYCFQEEMCPETNRPHIQGCVKFASKIRPVPGLKLPEIIHWEVMREAWQVSVNYCGKEESRIEGTVTTTKGCRVVKEVKTIMPDQFYPWQRKVYNIVNQEPDERSIHWIHEPYGNIGKSAFIKYLVVHEDAIFCAGSKTSDIINQVYNAFQANKAIHCILWDLPRSSQGKISFNAIESLKNGLIANTKYETGQAAFNSPHIFIFSNHEPVNTDDLSQDRWIIKEIDYINKDIDL